MWYIIAGIIIFVGFTAFTGAPYVPSKPREVKWAFSKLYKLSAKDVVVDIGSGDGLVLRAARREGARAVGYEINPVLVLIAKWMSRHDAGVEVRLANLWRRSLPDDVTVVYTFGDDRDIKRMYERVVNEATRIGRSIWLISYGFNILGIEPARSEGAYFLYRCDPLRTDQPEV